MDGRTVCTVAKTLFSCEETREKGKREQQKKEEEKRKKKEERRGLKVEATRGKVFVGSGGFLFAAFREELVDDVEGLEIDGLGRMILKEFNPFNTTARLDEITKLVAATFIDSVSNGEDVCETLKSDVDDAKIRTAEEFAKRGNATELNEKSDLILTSARGGVGKSPSGFLLDIKVGVIEEFDEDGDETVVNDVLDLDLSACGDVGDCPADLFEHRLAGDLEEFTKASQSTALNDVRRLKVVSSDGVSNDTKSGRLDAGIVVEEEFNDALHGAGLDDGADVVRVSIGDVGEGPKRVSNDFGVLRVEEFTEDGDEG